MFKMWIKLQTLINWFNLKPQFCYDLFVQMSRKQKNLYSTEKVSAAVLSVLKSSPEKTLEIKQIYMRLGAHTPQKRKKIEQILLFFCNKKKLIRINKETYKVKINKNYYDGIFNSTSNGAGYIKSEDFNIW